MLPRGLNPKRMEKMMKRMGIKVDEIDASQVIIKCADKDIVIDEPSVVRTNVQGQDMFQISGKISESVSEASIEINEDDVKMVAEQAKVSEEKARKALEESNGDIAEAILKLKG